MNKPNKTLYQYCVLPVASYEELLRAAAKGNQASANQDSAAKLRGEGSGEGDLLPAKESIPPLADPVMKGTEVKQEASAAFSDTAKNARLPEFPAAAAAPASSSAEIDKFPPYYIGSLRFPDD